MNVELLIEEQVHLVQAHPSHSLEDVPRVLHPVHVAYLGSVIGRDGKLGDLQTLQDELNDDLGIKVKVVCISLEGNLRQSFGGIDPITRMKLGERSPKNPVLETG